MTRALFDYIAHGGSEADRQAAIAEYQDGALAREIEIAQELEKEVSRLRQINKELLAALCDLVECHAEGGFVEPDKEVLEAASAAIAKAMGE